MNTDPVLARRARIARLVSLGKRFGYGLFLVSIVAFFASLVLGVNDAWVALVIGSMMLGSLLLIPAIIFGYAVKAAEREDRDRAAAKARARARPENR